MSAGQGSLPPDVRRQRILARLADESFVHVHDLSVAFGISEVTVRGDLDALAEDGRIQRVRGGAVPRVIAMEVPHDQQQARHAAEKLAIGRVAAGLISSGESLIVDVGTTTAAAAAALVQRRGLKDITAFTNGIQIAMELERAGDRFTVVVTGGILRRLQHSLVGALSTDLLARIRVDTVFLGCTAVDEEGGFTNVNLEETELKRLALCVARRRVFLADGSKLGRVGLIQICGIAQADMLITSADADPELVARLRERGLEVILAGEGDDAARNGDPPRQVANSQPIGPDAHQRKEEE